MPDNCSYFSQKCQIWNFLQKSYWTEFWGNLLGFLSLTSVKKIPKSRVYGKRNKASDKTAQNRVFITFFMHLLMENSINCLYPTLAMPILSGVSVGRQPHAAPAPPGAVSTEMTARMARGSAPSVEGAPSATSWRKVSTEQEAVSLALPGAARPRDAPRTVGGKAELWVTVLAVDSVGEGLPQQVVWIPSCGFAGVVGCPPDRCYC